MENNFKEGDLVLCTVAEISKTVVFVRIEENGEGTIITSEIAPGRIRNIRDYVVPNKKIVCKIIKIGDEGNIYLSLRRVSEKEKKEVMDRFEKEKTAASILKSVIKENFEKTIEEIKKASSLNEFLCKCRENPAELEKYMKKADAEKVCRILQEKKEKIVEVKKKFKLSSKNPDGIKIIKKILSSCQGSCEIRYISAGNFTIRIKAGNYKEANTKVSKSLEEIEKQAKEKKADFQEIEK